MKYKNKDIDMNKDKNKEKRSLNCCQGNLKWKGPTIGWGHGGE